ncbi:hypothetical protein [Streptomyces sp. NBC_01803]|uniref:hypothetical protein n=1 Tax=Streptomyces sp. NBC_01803 TaxID=2975946 RepID=UPI002DD83C98|nr:hypothetical protein [Streptomyces sp. NBC_01803]WSA45307.1 hypothetical protein OIE51_14475 [Streptomyces sp. NBC_01803]
MNDHLPQHRTIQSPYGWPAQPAEITPYQPMPLEIPVGERRIVGYTRYGDCLMPVYEARTESALLPAPRDLTPQPLIDPRAQVLAGGGVCAAGIGYGAGQILNAFAGIGSGALMALALILLAAKMPARHTGGDTYHVTNHNRWFGKSTTNL